MGRRVVTGYRPVDVRAADPDSAAAHAVLTAYFTDIVSRYHGREATVAEVAAVMSAEPSDDLRPPRGLLLLARQDGNTLGCAGLRLLPAGTGEVTRVFVRPEARRQGVGRQLLAAVEDAARSHHLSRLRLDTSRHLTEARQLYESDGYREVVPFNHGPFTDRWYEKPLD